MRRMQPFGWMVFCEKDATFWKVQYRLLLQCNNTIYKNPGGPQPSSLTFL